MQPKAENPTTIGSVLRCALGPVERCSLGPGPRSRLGTSLATRFEPRKRESFPELFRPSRERPIAIVTSPAPPLSLFHSQQLSWRKAFGWRERGGDARATHALGRPSGS